VSSPFERCTCSHLRGGHAFVGIDHCLTCGCVKFESIPVDTTPEEELFLRAFYAAMKETDWGSHPNNDRLREIYRREATK